MGKQRRHDNFSTRSNLDVEHGRALVASDPLGRERAVIITVDASRHAYRVRTSSGRTFTVGRLRQGPGDNTLLPVHSVVRIDYSLGEPYIDGVLPSEVPLTGDNNVGITGTDGHGGDDPVLSRNLGGSFRGPGEPADLIPGDQSMRSPDGANVSALHGKVAQLFGSPLSQVRAFGTTDSVEIISGLLRIITWMGESRYVNEDGKTSFIWRGGSDQLTEAGPDEERYTLRLDVGHRGDLFKFEVTNQDGQAVFRFHVNPEGKLTILAADGVSMTTGREPGSRTVEQIQGAREEVVEGALTVRISGATTERYQGPHTTLVSGQRVKLHLSDVHERINRSLSVDVGTDDTKNIGGDRTTTVVGDDTLHVRANLITDCVTTETTATTSVKTTAPTIHLNSRDTKIGENPESHGTKYEELSRVLNQIILHINELKGQVAAHTHPVVLTPTQVATPSAELTAPSFVSALEVDHTPARSTTLTLE